MNLAEAHQRIQIKLFGAFFTCDVCDKNRGEKQKYQLGKI